MGTLIEINLDRLTSNIKNLKSLLRPETKFLAVVKSNAYGHGLVETARAANLAGANWFGVVYLEEAMTLRQAGILKPILLLKGVSVADARQAANQDISVPVVSLENAREISETNFDKPLKVHLKVDTGLNRLGLSIAEIVEAVRVLKTNKNIILEGVYSHLASVEESDLDYTDKQIKNFKLAVKELESAGYKGFIKHLAATAATMLLAESHFDMVRCGIGIYGLWPSQENKVSFNRPDFLLPVLNYKTELTQIKKVAQGEKIGYGCTYETQKDMIIGIIPVGYYEGIDRGLSNNGEVLISGQRCPIVGRICMNLSIIDITDIDAEVGGEVVIIGRQAAEEITADEIANKTNTINYEVVTRIPAHIKREYI